MKILFLDCETSDVSPLSGQIIEIGGVIAELDPNSLEITILDQFEELVRNRKDFDDKTTRITGITETELAIAPNIIDVQEKWADWLEKYDKDIMAICGHSISFDLSFLKSESWFLPEKAHVIDSLILSKILFSEFTAVNLEFLIEKLKLLNFVQKNNHQVVLAGNRPHRALFDTWCSASLLQSILDILRNINFSQDFYNFLNFEILPLNLNFYSQEETIDKTQLKTETPNTIYLDLEGNPVKNSNSERFNNICLYSGDEEISKLSQLLLTNLTTDLKTIVAACYVGIIYKKHNSKQNLKLHIYTNTEKLFVDLLLELLEDRYITVLDQSELNTTTCYAIKQFENLIWQVKQLSEEVIDIGQLVTYLEILQKIDSTNSNSKIGSCLSAYDFFLMTMEPHWASNYYQYWYRPREMLGEEVIIKNKFYNLLNNLKELPITAESDNFLTQILYKRINLFIEKLNYLRLSSERNYQFRMANQKFIISLFKPNFNLNSSFEDLFNKYPFLELETYLSKEHFTTLLNCTGLTKTIDLYKIKVNYLNEETKVYKQKNYSSLLEVLQSRHLLAMEKQAPILILTGNNLSLKKVQKLLIENFDSQEYLSLGESGSLTKVYSKLVRDFVGLVNIRVGDFGFINIQKNLPQFAEIWIIGQPYIFVQQYWQNIAKQNSNPQLFTHTLQDLNFHAQAGYIYHETGQIVNYFPLN